MKQPRSTIRSPYMEWAKLCSAAPYNLATSGMAEYPLAQLGADLPQLEINDSSPYGYPPLRERLARKSQAPPQCVVMAAGTSLANHLAIWPGVAIMLAVMGLNFLGDGLIDALDPKYRKEM